MDSIRLTPDITKASDPSDAIISILRDRQAGISIEELLDDLVAMGLDEAATKAAVSQLLAEGKIEMTSQRKLQLPTTGRP